DRLLPLRIERRPEEGLCTVVPGAELLEPADVLLLLARSDLRPRVPAGVPLPGDPRHDRGGQVTLVLRRAELRLVAEDGGPGLHPVLEVLAGHVLRQPAE